MSIDMTLGERIKALRHQMQWTISEVAKRSNLNPAYLSRLEANSYENPGVFTIATIADVFGMTLDELLHATPTPVPVTPDDRIKELESRIAALEATSPKAPTVKPKRK